MLLQATGLTKSFGKGSKLVQAVKEAELQIAEGSILAFLGPNGAGKTTTIKMIAGLIEPDFGEILIHGKNPHRDRSVFEEVGVVLEGSRNVYLQMSVRDNLMYFGALKGMSAKAARTRADELIASFQLNAKANSRLRELSSGMQQKVTVAVSLMCRPKLLLLDEPTNALDVETAELVKSMLRDLAKQGIAILLTTHQLDVAQKIAHRVSIIRGGSILIEGETGELLRRFSGDVYKVKFEGELSVEQRSKLSALGVSIEEQTLNFHDAQLVYPVLDVVKPNAVMELVKADADLSSIFMKLVKEEAHA